MSSSNHVPTGLTDALLKDFYEGLILNLLFFKDLKILKDYLQYTYSYALVLLHQSVYHDISIILFPSALFFP